MPNLNNLQVSLSPQKNRQSISFLQSLNDDGMRYGMDGRSSQLT